jgi:hypothetical protein
VATTDIPVRARRGFPRLWRVHGNLLLGRHCGQYRRTCIDLHHALSGGGRGIRPACRLVFSVCLGQLPSPLLSTGASARVGRLRRGFIPLSERYVVHALLGACNLASDLISGLIISPTGNETLIVVTIHQGSVRPCLSEATKNSGRKLCFNPVRILNFIKYQNASRPSFRPIFLPSW